MDPFNQNEMNRGPQDNQTGQLPNLVNFNEDLVGLYGEEEPSKAEKLIGKGVGVLTKTFIFLILGIALATLGMLLVPFMRLVHEFSQWAYEFVGRLF